MELIKRPARNIIYIALNVIHSGCHTGPWFASSFQKARLGSSALFTHLIQSCLTGSGSPVPLNLQDLSHHQLFDPFNRRWRWGLNLGYLHAKYCVLYVCMCFTAERDQRLLGDFWLWIATSLEQTIVKASLTTVWMEPMISPVSFECCFPPNPSL